MTTDFHYPSVTTATSSSTSSSRLDYWDALFPTGYPMPTFNPGSAITSQKTCHKDRYGGCSGSGWESWSESKRAAVIVVVIVVAVIVIVSCGCCNSKKPRDRKRSQSVTLEELQNDQQRLARAIDEQRDVERSQAPPQTRPQDVPPTYQEALKHQEPTPVPMAMPTEHERQGGDNPPNGWPPSYMDSASTTTVTQPAPTASLPSRTPYPSLPSSPTR
ncbi:hypothetical protein P3342_008529 [Pyrenophora teres f. teres]|uniref:Uncharacterized protein n=1 Tax=Pyrenophora teres f. teres TaxID=97479 RepID=A0A6S6W669_9PLEO|nr:hypothetical protein P3342_008529 [Pyrenophora teres f. teres]CAE7186345.1 hypothetical protein PTTW11_06952 [Pyrenophora teres f. teres]